MESLRQWLHSPDPVSVRTLTGRAGAGKSRIAIELIKWLETEAPGGWFAGFAGGREMERFAGQQNLAEWGWAKPTLVVVDYAASVTGPLRVWLRDLAQRPAGVSALSLRLLLLEREASVNEGWLRLLCDGGYSEAGVVMFVKITDEGAVGNVEGFFLTKPAAELDGGPVELARECGIVHDGQDFRLDVGGSEFARSSVPGAVGEPVDALLIDARDPESQAALAAAAVAENQIVGDSNEQQVDGIEAAVRLAIRTTRHGLLELRERAGFLIGKLAGTTDAAIPTTSNGRTRLL